MYPIGWLLDTCENKLKELEIKKKILKNQVNHLKVSIDYFIKKHKCSKEGNFRFLLPKSFLINFKTSCQKFQNVLLYLATEPNLFQNFKTGKERNVLFKQFKNQSWKCSIKLIIQVLLSSLYYSFCDSKEIK